LNFPDKIGALASFIVIYKQGPIFIDLAHAGEGMNPLISYSFTKKHINDHFTNKI